MTVRSARMRVSSTLLPLFVVAAGALPAAAQGVVFTPAARMPAGGAAPAPPDVVPFHRVIPAQGAGFAGFHMELLAADPLEMGEAVTGVPYSANAVAEVVQVLADGNRITRRTTTSVARDGRGRVRREQAISAIGPILPDGSIVTISDPAAKTYLTLDPAGKRVIRQKQVVVENVGAGPANVAEAFVKELSGAVEVRKFATAVPTASAPATGAPTTETRTTQLGTQRIEGVTAEGVRTTTVIPAGAIGNDAAIEIVNERWYSPELRTVVLTRRYDPRFGETTYRLENVVLAEPPAELFEVPPDYSNDRSFEVLPRPPARNAQPR